MTDSAKRKIVYVTNTRFPTEKAHGLATVKLCEAFADIGWAVEVVAPALWRKSSQNVFGYYGVKPNFKIHKIPLFLQVNVYK